MEALSGLHFLVRRWGIEPQGRSNLTLFTPRFSRRIALPETWPLRPTDPLAHRMDSSAHSVFPLSLNDSQHISRKCESERNGVKRAPKCNGRNDQRRKLNDNFIISYPLQPVKFLKSDIQNVRDHNPLPAHENQYAPDIINPF